MSQFLCFDYVTLLAQRVMMMMIGGCLQRVHEEACLACNSMCACYESRATDSRADWSCCFQLVDGWLIEGPGWGAWLRSSYFCDQYMCNMTV
jgi:hypothetical protein